MIIVPLLPTQWSKKMKIQKKDYLINYINGLNQKDLRKQNNVTLIKVINLYPMTATENGKIQKVKI